MNAPRVRCPTCRRELEWNEEFPWRPFCSERCKLVDLGAWFAEERAITSEPGNGLEKAED
jgi:endogenous inhibitor of DNA gyrase (YacG/DUF329 family)